MPPSVQNGAPTGAKPPGKVPAKKGALAGMPKWAWFAAAGIGLVIGYMIVKKSGSSATPDTTTGNDSGSSSNPLGTSDSGTGGGTVAAPPPDYSTLMNQLQALGLSSNPGGPNQPISTPDQSLGTSPAPAPDNVGAGAGFISPETAPYVGIPNAPTHPGGNVLIQNVPSTGSNIHQPGQQLQ